jgi:hypothetical protein
MQTNAQPSPNPPALSTINDPLLTEKQIEEQTGGVIKAVSLRNWRSQGKHLDALPFVKVGSRIYYRASVVEKFLTPAV